MSDFLKADRVSDGHYRVLAIPFGGPLKGGRDLDGEYFSPRTDVKADWFPQRPVLFHHGMDRRLKDRVIGREGPLEKSDEGWWAEMWLDQQDEYFEMLDQMIAAGKMYGSSGSISHLVRKGPDREILVWPHVEQTLTLTPANVFAHVTASKAVDHFTFAGIAMDAALKGVLADLDALTHDLRPTYPETGGIDAASEEARLAAVLDELDGLLRNV